MKASELRIGNYVYYDDDIIEVEAYQLYILTDYFEPIPLTEEWLVKFGFELDEAFDDGDSVNTNHKKKVNCDEELYISLGLGIWQLVSDVHVCYTHNREIKHVHQLQNLYFALTCEELTLSE